MATPTHPHRATSYHGTEGDGNDPYNWQHWQDGHIRPGTHPAYATRKLDAASTSPGTANLFEKWDIPVIPEMAFENTFGAPIDGLNGYLDFFSCSESMLLPTGPLIPPVNQLGEWNNPSPPVIFPSTLHVPPSTPTTYGSRALDPAAMGQDQCFDMFENNDSYTSRESASVNNELLLKHAASCVLPSADEFENLLNGEFPPNIMSDFQHDFQNPAVLAEVATQHPFPGVYGPHLGLPIYNMGTPLPTGQQWDVELPRIGTERSSPPIPGFQSYNMSHILNSNFTLGTPPPLASQSPCTIMGHSFATESPVKGRRIMPKTMDGKPEGIVQTPKRRGRKGGLTAKAKVRANKMRQVGACTPCYARHVQCSGGEPCSGCSGHKQALHLVNHCTNYGLQIYWENFSPSFLGLHLGQTAIEKLTHPLEFIDNEIFVELSTGASHPPISLLVCEFVPPSKNFLKVVDSTSTSESDEQSFGKVRSLQWAVLEHNKDQLKAQCLEYIKAVSNRDIATADSTLSEEIMQAIYRFQQVDSIAQTEDLLAKAIRVYHLHFVLGTNIYFSSASVDKAVMSLQGVATGLPFRSRISARVLIRQIKGVVNDMLNESVAELLYLYNKELRDKRSETWLLCLLTHLILSKCAERVQIQIDGFIVFRIPEGDCDSTAIRNCGIEVCRRLDYVLDHAWILMCGKLKTRLNKRNPFRHGYQVAEGEVFKESELNLVNEFRRILSDHREAISRKSKVPCLGGSSRTPDNFNGFEEKNTDRLLSKFLHKLY